MKKVFQTAGLSVGMGILGEQFNSPGLKAGGEVAGSFIKPMVNISMGGTTIKILKKLK